MFNDTETVRDSLRKIVESRLEQTEGPLEAWAATTNHMIEWTEDAGSNAEIPLFIRNLCGRAIDRNFGRYSIGALINVLRPGAD